ncbi:helix-turn-helix domain-containing protein [Actinocrispum wychmicini]|uniref:helix-turn-helix domain-containing protein n=1 Tax=Actinocrispum wychmicini TaxID=1213861 RepID=UPI0010429733
MAAASSPDDPVYYRPSEVASILRCSEWWVKEQARKRRIPFSWIGGSYLFTADHIVEIVALFERRPADESATTTTNRTRSAEGLTKSTTDKPIVQLVARVPRRARGTESAT